MNCFYKESKSNKKEKKKIFFLFFLCVCVEGGGLGWETGGGVDGLTDQTRSNQFAPSTSSKLGA